MTNITEQDKTRLMVLLNLKSIVLKLSHWIPASAEMTMLRSTYCELMDRKPVTILCNLICSENSRAINIIQKPL